MTIKIFTKTKVSAILAKGAHEQSRVKGSSFLVREFCDEGVCQMCGICGVIEPGDADLVNLVLHLEFWLQHRGQEAAGIAVSVGSLIVAEKWEGRVDRFGVIQSDRLQIRNDNRAQIAIGHVRYGNTGADARENYQPFVSRTEFGKIALVHNGNLTNTAELIALLKERGYGPDGTTDSELIILLIAYHSRNSNVTSIEEAIQLAVQQLKGSFSLIVMTNDKLIGLRDPWGIRPLSFGRLNDSGFVFASESCALEAIGAELVCDLRAGEMIVADLFSNYAKTQVLAMICEKMCIFEPIYFAFPGSVLHDRSVETARRHMGEELWNEHPVETSDLDEWIVCGTPNTGIPAALGFAAASGIEYRRGFVKNEYVFRTFIQPDQRLRKRDVRLKLQALRREVTGKKVVLIEDSIVRATTTSQLIPALKAAGAREVHMRVTSPPYKFTCNLGTDTQDSSELIAAHRSVEEIRQYIGADSLGYLSLEGLFRAIEPVPGYDFCTGCFNQQYPL